jgi:hypothetical protein
MFEKKKKSVCDFGSIEIGLIFYDRQAVSGHTHGISGLHWTT